MAYTSDYQDPGDPSGPPPGLPPGGGESSWIEDAISDAASWVVSTFGNQAEERNLRRFAQNEAAFRAAAAGGSWDGEFLKARSGLYGPIEIPVRLPYAVSPSSGNAETPGALSGWATGPAKRHAEALYDRLQAGETDPGTGPVGDGDPSVTEELYTTARTNGRAAAEQLLQTIAANIYGQIPEDYRRAIEAGVRDHYAQGAGEGLRAAVPWVVGLGVGLALLRRK